jgi:hypothetical protein
MRDDVAGAAEAQPLARRLVDGQPPQIRLRTRGEEDWRQLANPMRCVQDNILLVCKAIQNTTPKRCEAPTSLCYITWRMFTTHYSEQN